MLQRFDLVSHFDIVIIFFLVQGLNHLDIALDLEDVEDGAFADIDVFFYFFVIIDAVA